MMKFFIVAVILATLLAGCASKEGNEQKNDAGKNTQQVVKDESISKDDKEENDQQAKEENEKSTQNVTVVGKGEAPKEQVATESNKQQTDVAKQQVVASKASKETTVPKANQSTTKTSETKIQTNKGVSQSQVQKKTASTNSSNQAAASKAEQKKTSNIQEHEATISIKGDQQTGIILKTTKVEIQAGDTVLDILKKVTKQNRIQMEYRGSGGTAYIEGINNLYEFDKGPKSGWMYSVNGAFMRKGAGLSEVKPGDKIEWVYTLDLGKDVGQNVSE